MRTRVCRLFCPLFLSLALTSCDGGAGGQAANQPSGAGSQPPVESAAAVAGEQPESPDPVEVDLSAAGADERPGPAAGVREQPDAAASPTPAPRPTSAAEDSEDLHVFQLVDLARRTYLAAGGGDGGVQAAVSRLKAHPAAATVEVVDVESGPAIKVTDRSGMSASFRTRTPPR